MTMKKIILLLLLPIMSLAQDTKDNNDVIISYVNQNIGKHIGSGICFDLVDKAIMQVDKKWKDVKRKDHEYEYGKKVKSSDVKPGDIITLDDVRLPDGRYVASHVAIIYKVIDLENRIFELVEQNADGLPTNKTKVIVQQEDIGNARGKIKFYRHI